MFGKQRSSSGSTIIAKGDAFEGTLKVRGDLHIDGEIVGNVFSDGTISVGPEGHVEGELHGTDVVVGGRVEGTVRARGALHTLSGGAVKGDVYYQTLQVDRGGVVHGHTGGIDEKSSSEAAADQNVEPFEEGAEEEDLALSEEHAAARVG